jgi:hypothetical protein
MSEAKYGVRWLDTAFPFSFHISVEVKSSKGESGIKLPHSKGFAIFFKFDSCTRLQISTVGFDLEEKPH